jgi:hypothetical protein
MQQKVALRPTKHRLSCEYCQVAKARNTKTATKKIDRNLTAGVNREYGIFILPKWEYGPIAAIAGKFSSIGGRMTSFRKLGLKILRPLEGLQTALTAIFGASCHGICVRCFWSQRCFPSAIPLNRFPVRHHFFKRPKSLGICFKYTNFVLGRGGRTWQLSSRFRAAFQC